MRSSYSAHEIYPDPSDDYLIDTLKENYSPADVKGYGGRLRRLRRDFLYCSKLRAFTLKNRLSARTRGDRLSELFHDRLSHGGRAFFSVSWGSGLSDHMQDGGLDVFLGCSFPAFSFNGRKLNRGYTFLPPSCSGINMLPKRAVKKSFVPGTSTNPRRNRSDVVHLFNRLLAGRCLPCQRSTK
jgi:hypothetical protein